MTIKIKYTERDLQNIRNIIGFNLRAARKNARLSQSDVMKAIYGVSNNRNRVSEIETGTKKEITISEILKFQRLYGQSLDYICGLSTEPDIDMVAGSVNHIVNQSQALVEFITTEISEVVVNQMKAVAKDDHIALIEQSKSLCDSVKADYRDGRASPESLHVVSRLMYIIRAIEVKQARQKQAIETQMIQITERLSNKDEHRMIRDMDKHYQYSIPIHIIDTLDDTLNPDCVDVAFTEVYNGR